MRSNATGKVLPSRVAALLALLLLTGCASNDGALLFGRYLWEGIIAPPETTYGRADVRAIPFATLGIAFGRQARTIVALESVQGRDHRWVTADPYVLVTRGGRVVSTAGLPANLSASRFPEPDPVDGRLHRLTGPMETVRLIDLTENRIFDQRVRCTLRPRGTDTITILGIERDLLRVTERCKARRIHWRFTNTYWVDADTGRVWRSRQHLHPAIPALTVDVLRPAREG